MKKVFFIDVDGTILPHGRNEKVSDKTKYSINELRKAGHEVVIATGKSRQMVNDILNELNMTNFITCNGAVIYKDSEILWTNEITKEESDKIIEFCKQNNLMFGVQQDDEYYMLDINIDKDIYEKAFLSINLDVPAVEKDIKDKIYQGWMLGDISNIDHTKELVKGYKQMKWHDNAIDIISKEISKESAIRKYIEENYSGDIEVYCFGDGENDIEMIKYATYGVAMGNACDRLKEAADIITDTCINDGVYKYLVDNNLIKEM